MGAAKNDDAMAAPNFTMARDLTRRGSPSSDAVRRVGRAIALNMRPSPDMRGTVRSPLGPASHQIETFAACRSNI